jgi:hypothetical protein
MNGEDTDELNMEYEDTIENVLCELPDFERCDDYISRNTDTIAVRNFPYFDQDDESWDYLKLYITVEPGYYEGCMFNIVTPGIDSIDDVAMSDTNRKKLWSILRRIEGVMKKYTTQIRRVATFSNGETIYERV